MNEHKTTAGFWKRYAALPRDISELADKNFALLKQNPRQPSLHFKDVGKAWSVRVGLDYRALALRRHDDFYRFWIGSHDEYERLLA